MIHRACPLCGSTESNALFGFSVPLFDDTPISGRFDLDECGRCGFVFYDTPSGKEEWNEFYGNHYLIRFYSERESHGDRLDYLKRTAAILAEAGVSTDGFIADVGSGPGHLLTLLRDGGHARVAGIELCDEHLAELRRRGIPAFHGSAERLPLDDESVDALVYGNILEHLLLPVEAVQEMRRCLRPGGKVLVEVPDMTRYDALAQVHPITQFIVEHVNHFSLNHLTRFFRAHGFELIAHNADLYDNMPILRAVYEKGAGQPPAAISDADFELGPKLRHWLSTVPDYVNSVLGQLAAPDQPVHVWGISYQTLGRLSLIGWDRLNIAGLYDIDARKREKTLSGMEIKHPERLEGVSSDEAIIVGVGPSTPKMHGMLVENGFEGRIVHL